MYSHSRSFGGHQSNHSTAPTSLSHYAHQPPSSSYHHHQRGGSSSTSHHHVLQNPPQSTLTSNFGSTDGPSSPPRGSSYQPFYPNVISVNSNQEGWNGGTSSLNEGASSSNQVGNGSGRDNFGHGASGSRASPASRSRNLNTFHRETPLSTTSSSSRNAIGASSKQLDHLDGRKSKPVPISTSTSSSTGGGGGGGGIVGSGSSASIAGKGPNWGLIGRQLSQIAGDVSTSVRQNELMISLLERLVDRMEAIPNTSALQGGGVDYVVREASGQDQEPEGERGETTSSSRSTGRRQSVYASAAEHVNTTGHQNRQESGQPSGVVVPSQIDQSTGNNTHAPVAYLNGDLGSQSFDFIPTPQAINNRNHYPGSVSHSSFDADLRPKRTPPRVSYLLSSGGGDTTSSHTATTTAAPVHSFSNPIGSSSRQHQQQQQQQQQQQSIHQHSNPQEIPSITATAATHTEGGVDDENYNRIPSPVFDDTVPADEEPPEGLGFTQYYPTEDNRARRGDHSNKRVQISSPEQQPSLSVSRPQQPTPPSNSTRPQEDGGGHLSIMQSASMGSLEDAGLIPVSTSSSNSATPAPKTTTTTATTNTTRSRGGDVSIISSIGNMTEEDDGQEAANDQWKEWQEPKRRDPSTLKSIPKAKYKTARQVKQERKEKTKRSMSTIGRIPLKEYLEVGSDYKSVRRTARSVYNTWLQLNVRLAKQDPDRLMACYHKLEYDYPILADCEDHWKAKELMLQVIDNAIDEIAFHRRREERRAKQDTEHRDGRHNVNTETRVGSRRDASAADLYTSEDTRPTTRRRKGTTTTGASQAPSNTTQRVGSDKEMDATIFTRQQQQHSNGNNSGNFNGFEHQALATRSSNEQQQQQQSTPPSAAHQHNQPHHQNWTTHAGDSANLFAQAHAFTTQNQQQNATPVRTSARRNPQSHSQGW